MLAASCIGIVILVISIEFMRRLGREDDEFIVRQWHRQAAAASDVVIREARESATPSKAILFRATPLQQLLRAIIYYAITFTAIKVIMLLAMYFNGILSFVSFWVPALAILFVTGFLLESIQNRTKLKAHYPRPRCRQPYAAITKEYPPVVTGPARLACR
ncbi:hypothetical protein GGI42DRAFT_313049 [Trichoderma sp. SZMC 28013]